jgi:hypothetical protein
LSDVTEKATVSLVLITDARSDIFLSLVPSYTTPPTTLADNGALFAVIVSDRAGSVTSNNATLSVTPGTSATAATLDFTGCQ